MPKSTRNTRKLRARLLLAGTSVPQIARKHGAAVPTVYAVLNGTRPGTRTPAVQRALEEIRNV